MWYCEATLPGSRSLFLKYPRWNKPCLRFDKAPETDFFFLLAPRWRGKHQYRWEKNILWNLGWDYVRPDNEHNFSPGKGIQIPESAKCLVLESGIWEFYLVESGILDFEIHNTAQGNRNGTNHWNAESKFLWQRTRNPESETVLDSFTWS